MAAKSKGQRINGWVVIDKPAGLTSTQVVGRVRRAFRPRKIGHGGTLDPLATGLLPIAMGEATKTVPYVMDGAKTYRFTLRWGEATATDDAEGEVVARSDRRPSPEEVRAVLARFVGEIDQVPPAYSAIKVEGRRAYDMARANETFRLAPRRVVIHRLELIETPDADYATLEVECGKGAYMRALARDLGQALGTCAHVVALRRTAVGPFRESHAISLESLEALGHSAAGSGALLPVEAALDDIPALALTEIEANRLRSGQAVSMLARANRDRIRDVANGAIVFATAGGKPVALARYEAGDIRPVRVLNL
ncbi:MAG: tRNA pseudouridine(55) synthase TruB [Alphaproteobacteria bacterium]|nr:MAG: tRNA pseudouridine(55) synthase TruB [Alphaproteobacteria bacterium]